MQNKERVFYLFDKMCFTLKLHSTVRPESYAYTSIPISFTSNDSSVQRPTLNLNRMRVNVWNLFFFEHFRFYIKLVYMLKPWNWIKYCKECINKCKLILFIYNVDFIISFNSIYLNGVHILSKCDLHFHLLHFFILNDVRIRNQ